MWLLVLPFLWFASATPRSLLIGGSVALAGLFIRGWSAGQLQKDKQLTTSGPYSFTRNPLYLGSFLLGVGFTLAGNLYWFTAAFVVFYLWVYTRTMRHEEDVLLELFGDEYARYRDAVPRFRPRVTPYRPEDKAQVTQFSLSRYLQNKEWEAALGAFAGFVYLAVRLYAF